MSCSTSVWFELIRDRNSVTNTDRWSRFRARYGPEARSSEPVGPRYRLAVGAKAADQKSWTVQSKPRSAQPDSIGLRIRNPLVGFRMSRVVTVVTETVGRRYLRSGNRQTS